MAKINPETIILKGCPMIKEGVTDEKLSPGHALERGGGKDVQKVSTASRRAGVMIALENDLNAEGITDEYAANDRVRIGVFRSRARGLRQSR